MSTSRDILQRKAKMSDEFQEALERANKALEKIGKLEPEELVREGPRSYVIQRETKKMKNAAKSIKILRTRLLEIEEEWNEKYAGIPAAIVAKTPRSEPDWKGKMYDKSPLNWVGPEYVTERGWKIKSIYGIKFMSIEALCMVAKNIHLLEEQILIEAQKVEDDIQKALDVLLPKDRY